MHHTITRVGQTQVSRTVKIRDRDGNVAHHCHYTWGGCADRYERADNFANFVAAPHMIGRLLGTGNFSSVWEVPWSRNKVLKIGLGPMGRIGQPLADGWLAYGGACLAAYRRNDWNPLRLAVYDLRVHKYFYIALIERLDLESHKFEDSSFWSNGPRDVVEQMEVRIRAIKRGQRPIGKGYKQPDMYFEECRQNMWADMPYLSGDDIHGANVMLQFSTGRVVLIDPDSFGSDRVPEILVELGVVAQPPKPTANEEMAI